jgi:hypothetical protein
MLGTTTSPAKPSRDHQTIPAYVDDRLAKRIEHPQAPVSAIKSPNLAGPMPATINAAEPTGIKSDCTEDCVEEHTEDLHAQALASTPEVPPADGHCHFFRLSGELRNMIYEYAVSEPQGLYYRRDDNAGRFLPHATEVEDLSASTQESNQLTYVNRELHLETKRLGPRYNDVHFSTCADAAYFLFNVYPVTQSRYLRRIHIAKATSKPSFANSKQVTALIQFCRANPHIAVHHRLAHLDQHQPMFYMLCMTTQALHKGTAELAHRLLTEPNYRARKIGHVLSFAGSKCLGKGRIVKPNNWRYMPFTAEFDEAAFVELAHGNNALRDAVERGGDETLDRWVATMKDIFENGI